MKKTIACLIATILSSAAYAERQHGSVQDAKHEVFKTFHSRAYKNEYPLRKMLGQRVTHIIPRYLFAGSTGHVSHGSTASAWPRTSPSGRGNGKRNIKIKKDE